MASARSHELRISPPKENPFINGKSRRHRRGAAKPVIVAGA